jgi:thiamine-monophosphate kinase
MDEFDLIQRLARTTAVPRADVVLGIGDDAALLAPARGKLLAVAMDTLVEGVHFPVGTAADAIGWKALAVNLSDLAAMGAEPAWATLALTLPRAESAWLASFARGFVRLARRHRVALVGGDTTRGPLTVTVQVHGFVPKREAITRSGARVGDAVYVSGTPGDAAAGLALRMAAHGRRQRDPAGNRERLVARLEYPAPRVGLGLALRGVASAAVDVSDGLLQDLGHVTEGSGVGAHIDAAALPLSRALTAVCDDAAQCLRHALTGGDDYELAFTVPPRRERLLAQRVAPLGVRLTRIGEIVAGRGVRVDGAPAVLAAAGGWRHFRSEPRG